MSQEREKLYWIWSSMVQRCTNPKNKSFHNYGGRGIKVCSDWIGTGKNFVKWAKEHGYKDGLDLDRIDNDGDYCPDNCRFADRSLSMKNRRIQKTSKTGVSGVWYRTKF